MVFSYWLHLVGWITKTIFTIYKKHLIFPIFIIPKVDKNLRRAENVDFDFVFNQEKNGNYTI